MALHLITGYAGQEHITSADQGSFNAAIVSDGEFVLERGNQLSANIISNNKVRILDGDILMQGRHIRLIEDTYDELDFENGSQGYKRNDLIVARYEKDSTTGIENCSFAILTGIPDENEPLDPNYVHGDIIHNHALINEMPLYRVTFNGLNMQPLVPLFYTFTTFENFRSKCFLKTSVSNVNVNDATKVPSSALMKKQIDRIDKIDAITPFKENGPLFSPYNKNTATVLVYHFGDENWSGIGCDSGGNFHIRVGLDNSNEKIADYRFSQDGIYKNGVKISL